MANHHKRRATSPAAPEARPPGRLDAGPQCVGAARRCPRIALAAPPAAYPRRGDHPSILSV